jgi:aspartate kinase
LNNKITVVKIGGSLLKRGKDYIYLAKLLKKRFQDHSLVIVVSAMKGVTDQLIQVARGDKRLIEKVREHRLYAAREIDEKYIEKIEKILKELELLSYNQDRVKTDQIIGYGEKLSKTLMEVALEASGFEVNSISASKLVIAEKIDGIARIDYSETRRRIEKLVKKEEKRNTVYLVEGFIASNKHEEPIVLGRGGSDYTTTAIGSILGAKRIYLYTITGAILSGDPSLIRNPLIISEMSYDEAEAASLFRVKGLHPLTFEPVKRYNRPEVIVGHLESDNQTIIRNGISSKPGKCEPKIVSYRKQDSLNAILLSLIGRCSRKRELAKRVEETLWSLGISWTGIEAPRRKPYLSIRVKGRCSLKRLVEAVHDNMVISS